MKRLVLSVLALLCASCDNVDTKTKVLAENVLYENKSNSTLESGDVQEALDDLSLSLKATIVGTWTIQNMHQEDAHSPAGNIVIREDGTFDLQNGSFAAAGIGSGDATETFCNHEQEGQTYTFYTDKLVAFTHSNGVGNVNSVIPTLIELARDKIVFLGSGGCGIVGLQRISVLTRGQ